MVERYEITATPINSNKFTCRRIQSLTWKVKILTWK